MFRKSLVLICALFLVLTVSGCRTVPVHNVTEAPVTTHKSNYQLADVRSAILRAGGGLGWQMREEAPGHIVGRLALRSHLAVVDIHYDRKNYSINYKDSNNLNYSGGSIHKNYNSWIQNLDRSIQSHLQTL